MSEKNKILIYNHCHINEIPSPGETDAFATFVRASGDIYRIVYSNSADITCFFDKADIFNQYLVRNYRNNYRIIEHKLKKYKIMLNGEPHFICKNGPFEMCEKINAIGNNLISVNTSESATIGNHQ